jgi:putative ubiquitin-RnfH superfamily antitoxin RatB of RatAB toxin-antitoxin module
VSEIRVTVVQALADEAIEVALLLPEGATIADAIAQAGANLRLAVADLSRCAVGIYGKRARRDTVLADGDRVELYRPLKVDPKQARRQRATGKQR